MKANQPIRVEQVTEHVFQVRIPTPTLLPSFETNTYVIQDNQFAIVIDVGSDDPQQIAHLAQILANHGIQKLNAILVTHYHHDHTLGIPLLQKHFPCNVYVHRLDLENTACELQDSVQSLFPMPDSFLLGHIKIDIQHAKGHTHGHIHALIPSEQVIFVGDNLAGDGSVWVGPPDGHMSDYFCALDMIAQSGCNIACPGHGNILRDASESAQKLKQRRILREEEIYKLLRTQQYTVDEIVSTLYKGTIPDNALWVAKRTIQAHLAHLAQNHRITVSFNEAKGQFYYHA